MKALVKKTEVFFKTLKGCLSDAWRDSDCYYHIPKSRFNGNSKSGDAGKPSQRIPRAPARNYFLGSFRDCLLTAWKVSDKEYHIPKSRFQDPEFNKNAYRGDGGPGVFSSIGRHAVTFKHCLAMSWKASDSFYHIPKSSYQKADFIRNLMELSPEPKGKLLYRPYMIGHGVVVGEAVGKGWNVPVPDEQLEGVFFAPDMIPETGHKPEMGK